MNRFRRMPSYYYVDNTDGRIVNPAVNALRDYTITGNVGKNLFDVTKCVSFSSEKGGIFLGADVERSKIQGNLKNIANVEAGKTYVISAQSTSSAGGLYVYLGGSKRVWTFYNSTVSGTKILELTQEDLDGGIYFYKSDSAATAPAEVIISNVQIEENTAATEFEPYKAVGDYDAESGKYKIPVKNGDEVTNILLDAPVKPGESINKINDSLPEIKLHGGINMLTVQTEVSPSAVNWQYYKY